MMSLRKALTLLGCQVAAIVLASVMAPAVAQQASSTTPDDNAAVAQSQVTPKSNSQMNAPKEGFWGHVNPFARKKWVKKQLDPINGQLNELDEVTAKNSRDITDVDSRAQAGIRKAQSTADSANGTALAANQQAKNAYGLANGAAGRVDGLNTTVNGLDSYHTVTEADVPFRSGTPTLTVAARKQLDELAEGLSGHQGYILEVEAHSPSAGSVGIQNSARLAESVKRYLVEKYDIPVYRMHTVALGNARSEDDDHRIRVSSVHVRLMENSLAAQGGSALTKTASPISSAERQ